MNKTMKPRLGSIVILFSVILLCVAVLSALSLATAHADASVTQRYEDTVQAIYDAETMGQSWLAKVHTAVMDTPEGEQITLPNGALEEKGIIEVKLTTETRELRIRLALTEEQPGYEILRWENLPLWEENQDIGNLWNGE